MENLKNKRILALIGLICLFLGVIMPYFKVSFFGYSYEIKLWGYWEGKVMMVLIMANVLFIFKDYIEKYVPQLFNTSLGNKIQKLSPKFAIVPTIAVAAFAIWLYIRLDVDTKYLKHGLGFWSLWVGVICLIGHTFLYKKSFNNNAPQVNYSQPQQQQPMQQMNYSQPQQQQPMQQMNYSQPQQNVEQNVKFCPGCGNKCDLNADKCFMCGRQF